MTAALLVLEPIFEADRNPLTPVRESPRIALAAQPVDVLTRSIAICGAGHREIAVQIAVAYLDHRSRLPKVDERNRDHYVKSRRAPQLAGGYAQLVLGRSARPRRFPKLSGHSRGEGATNGPDNQTPTGHGCCRRRAIPGVDARCKRGLGAKCEGGRWQCGSASRTTRAGVRLEEIAPDGRAPVLKAYLQIAPGARPHLPVAKDAPLSEFERVAAQFPVFRIATSSR
jgi:hypothetical protein